MTRPPFALGDTEAEGTQFRRRISTLEHELDRMAGEREHWRCSLDLAAEAIFLVDAADRYLYANDAGCVLHRRPRAEIIGRPLTDFETPESSAGGATLTASLKEAGFARRIGRLVRGDDTTIPVEFRSVSLGNSIHQCVIRDMSGWERTLAALRESEERYRTLFENATDALIVWGGAGRLLALNRQAEALTGYTAEEVLGQAPPLLFESSQVTRPIPLPEVVRAGGPQPGEFHLRRRDGSFTLVEASSSAIEPGQCLSILRDVTERKAAAAERDLLEQQMQYLQRMEAVGELAAGIAHDFKNFLAVVTAYLTIAKDQAGAGAQETIARAMEAASAAAMLSHQLLAIGRGSGRPREPTAVAPLVKTVLQLLESTVGPNVALQAAVPANAWVMGDRQALHQVLLNLVLNARDAMAEGGPLTVRARPAAEPPSSLGLPKRADGYTLLEIEDRGRGMDSDTVARMFDPFFSTKGEEGTGLGATMVYGIVREHEGMVTVESEPGQGTTVRLYLPAARAEDRVPADPDPPQPAVASATRS